MNRPEHHHDLWIVGLAHATGQAKSFEQLDMHPGQIEFKPAQSMASAGWKGVVIVMPALSEGQKRNPPAISGQIGTVEIPVAEGMGG